MLVLTVGSGNEQHQRCIILKLIFMIPKYSQSPPKKIEENFKLSISNDEKHLIKIDKHNPITSKQKYYRLI